MDKQEMLLKVASSDPSVNVLRAMYKSAAFERGLAGFLKALKVHANPRPFIQALAEKRFDQWDLIEQLLKRTQRDLKKAGPMSVDAATGLFRMEQDAANAGAKWNRLVRNTYPVGTPLLDDARARAARLYKHMADKALKRDAVTAGVGLGATAGGLYGANKLLESQKTASLSKEALQTVDQQKAQQMRDNHVDSRSIDNYQVQRNANGPEWYNPLDWIMNGWRYLRNDNQFEQNRALLNEMSMERYNKRLHDLNQRQAMAYYNKQQAKKQVQPAIINNAR